MTPPEETAAPTQRLVILYLSTANELRLVLTSYTSRLRYPNPSSSCECQTGGASRRIRQRPMLNLQDSPCNSLWSPVLPGRDTASLPPRTVVQPHARRITVSARLGRDSCMHPRPGQVVVLSGLPFGVSAEPIHCGFLNVTGRESRAPRSGRQCFMRRAMHGRQHALLR